MAVQEETSPCMQASTSPAWRMSVDGVVTSQGRRIDMTVHRVQPKQSDSSPPDLLLEDLMDVSVQIA